MVENIIPQAVTGDGVIHIVGLVGHPVIAEFFGTEHQHPQVAVLIILDNGQSSESLAKAHTVGQDTAVILLQFADDGQHRILLEGIEFIPDQTVLETICFVWQVVLADIFQEIVEDVVECKEVEKLRAVFLIGGSNPLQHLLRYILHPPFICPKLVEQLQISLAFRCVQLLNHAEHIATPFAAQIRPSEAVDWSIRHWVFAINGKKTRHCLIGAV